MISLGLGDPPGTGSLDRVLKDYPTARFKIDLTPQWNGPLVKVLARTGRITTVGLKGHYHGDFEGPPPNAAQYREVAEGLREAWIEDPAISVEPGAYIVIGKPAPPQDDKLIGVTVGQVGEGEVVSKQIQLVVDGDGNEVPSRTN